MDSTKKISFGFNKPNRKANILLNKEPAKQENSKVQLIEYLEEQAIKVIGSENILPSGPLVIPMKAPNKKLINLVDLVKNDFKDTIEDAQVKVDNAETSKDGRTLTLDELAAKELINGTSNNNSKNDVTKVIEVATTDKVSFDGEKESSLDDYESVPVDQFGKALLRGMGWKDGQGIGKNQQLVKVAQPVIRPKGMGLGADSITKKTDTPAAVDRNGKVLTCVKGAYVKVIAGYHKGYYGQIQGFDDESGRFIIKLTLTNINVSLNEFLVKPVTKEDYNKNSKVLNNAKYEEYLKHKEHSKQSVEKQVKQPEESDSKVRIKKELDDCSHDEETDYSKVQVKKEKDYTKAEVKKEKVSDEDGRRSRSHEEFTRKSREGKHKSKERNTKEKINNGRKKNDAKRYSNSESESEDNRRTNKHDPDEEYATTKSSKRYKDKKATRSDYEHERSKNSSRRYSESESEDRKSSNKAKKRDSEEKYERRSRKHSRNKKHNGSDSDSEEKYEKKSSKKNKYRDRSKHSTKDKRK